MEPTGFTTSFQDVELSDQVNSDCLGVPVILREIFQHFSTTELIQLSLVSKFWNYEARSLMRSRGNLTAIINKNHTCQDLRAFASDLRRMKQMKKMVPFSGLTISVGGTKCGSKDYCQQLPSRELLPVYEEILGGLTWKHFSLRHLAGWEEHKSCPGFILQKKIMRRFDSVLEELSVQLEWNKSRYLREELLQDCYFPCLKTFRLLNEWPSSQAEWSELIRTVVFNAPNLQVLHTNPHVNLEANLLEGSTAVHLTGYPYSPSENEISEGVASKLRMQGMDLFTFGSDFSLERFNGITQMLLRSSHAIMSLLNVDIVLLAPLINYGVCLENVRKFALGLDPWNVEEMQPHVGRIAKSFDYTRMFPNLNAVTITCRGYSSIPGEFNEMIEQVNAALDTSRPDRAANIKQLYLQRLPSSTQICSSYFRFLAQMFPDIQKLSIESNETSFVLIRDIWVDLKQVDVTLRWSVHWRPNLESEFCGIFPEEVDRLREEDEEYLKRVNIVPVMPSVAYLKELRTLKVYFTNDTDSPTGATRLLSKVTCLIAFQRCPDLTVTLTTENERLGAALDDLRRYASKNVLVKTKKVFPATAPSWSHVL